MNQTRYKRILLKLSGEALLGDAAFGISQDILAGIARQVRGVKEKGIEIAIVVGGGNIWRGETAAESGMERVSADYAGMLATIINALALQNALEKEGIGTRTQSAINIQAVAEPFIRRRAIRHLEKGRVVIFAAGTGNPYMTTDTAAALRSIEIGAEVLMMAKNRVDGVYDSDPLTNKDAKRFEHIAYIDALKMRLDVLDPTALSLCMENKLPIVVFDLRQQNSIERAVAGEPIGTLISSK
ncbi:UMP kinase [Chloroflexota bacterium]